MMPMAAILDVALIIEADAFVMARYEAGEFDLRMGAVG